MSLLIPEGLQLRRRRRPSWPTLSLKSLDGVRGCENVYMPVCIWICQLIRSTLIVFVERCVRLTKRCASRTLLACSYVWCRLRYRLVWPRCGRTEGTIENTPTKSNLIYSRRIVSNRVKREHVLSDAWWDTKCKNACDTSALSPARVRSEYSDLRYSETLINIQRWRYKLMHLMVHIVTHSRSVHPRDNQKSVCLKCVLFAATSNNVCMMK